MENLRANLIRFFVPFILLLMWGCSNGKLSNSKAEEALRAEYPRYITSMVQINDNSLSPIIPNELKQLSDRGLARYNYIPPGNSGYGCYGMLTEAGRPYLVSKINDNYIVLAVAKIDIDRILGIKEIPALNASEVEYTEKIVQITPVGEIYNDLNIGKSYNVSAIFIKYNEGWKMKEMTTGAKKFTISEKINQSSEKENLSNTTSTNVTATYTTPTFANQTNATSTNETSTIKSEKDYDLSYNLLTVEYGNYLTLEVNPGKRIQVLLTNDWCPIWSSGQIETYDDKQILRILSGKSFVHGPSCGPTQYFIFKNIGKTPINIKVGRCKSTEDCNIKFE